ncbi:carbohydrate ABC transporter permease [Kineosporia succinea]|uniref:Multiple sugar transport system permease protein n=1 Tax=Kineosporia succinea TaxID=84632 RepID=A0ABT9P651_9ACTN|nr:sugar ABC transporter permease [Kineosporia succinea]MDP9828159.1 multiple sugar transport system permease protein [Kineosporia succinea]
MTMASATARTVPPSRQPVRRKTRKDWRGWIFVGPFMAVFALVFIAPLVYAIYLSTYRNQLIGGNSFVGLDNYTQLFQDAAFWHALLRVLLFLVVQVPIMLGLALAAAMAIDSARLYGANLFRIVLFLPYAVPAVVAVLMWGFMYGDQFGLVGQLNEALGTGLNPFAGNWTLVSIGNIVTWSFVGYNMLIFYTTLKTIPTELYEAAELDGAGQFWIIRAIKWPALRGSMVIATIFSIIGSFQLFNEPNILRPLLPNVITTDYTPNMYAYTLAFSGQQQNYAATVAIVMGVVTAVIAYVVQLRGSRNEER